VESSQHSNRLKVTSAHRRRQLKRESTDAERALWRLLRNRQAGGAKFRRQHPIGRYVVDLYCFEHRLAIEADGGQHYTSSGLARDESRTRDLARMGVRVLRFTDIEILKQPDAVIEAIEQALRRQPGRDGAPSP
jgi:very-short-patch-repair endonuclease